MVATNVVYPEIVAGPPRPSLVVQPGLLLPGMERYHVPGGGAVLIDIEAGDHVTVRNLEGGQACELVAFDAAGRADPGILSTRSNSDASGLKALLVDGDESLQKFRLGLARRKLELGRVEAVRFFDGATAAGVEERFVVSRPGSLVIAAPGAPMSVDSQDTTTPLVVMVKRAKVRAVSGGFELPDPLADPVLDVRVKSKTAESYFVKAGDYIQIIDVDGRQCTDFQCFSARKLDKGRDLALDVTATRSLMGHAYPMPGLHAKYFDQDFEPLVEVVQDTCGRHDAFALACYAKYYDD
ncbi:uncharacterized protein YcgI (DUF1989 family), partial [Aminobacter ciceronei]